MNQHVKNAALSKLPIDVTKPVFLELEGTITALAPIHVSSPDTAKTSEEGLILIDHMVNGAVVRLPVVKGDTIKGMLRRASCRAMAVRLEEAGKPGVNEIQRYYRLAIGGVKGDEKQKPDDIEVMRKIMTRNTISSIFGQAEPVFIPGKLEFGMATAPSPDCITSVPGGARRDDMLRDPELLSSFPDSEQTRWMDYVMKNKDVSANNREIKKLKAEIMKVKKGSEPDRDLRIKEISQQIEDLEKTNKENRDGGLAGNSVNFPLAARKAIAPGTELAHKMVGNRLNLCELGTLIVGLEEFAEECRIGGHASRGFGEIKLRYDMRIRQNHKSTPIGTIQIERFNISLPDHPLIAAARSALETAIATSQIDLEY